MTRARVEYRLMNRYNDDPAEHAYSWVTNKRKVESLFNRLKKRYSKDFPVEVRNLGWFVVNLSSGSTLEYWIEKHQVK